MAQSSPSTPRHCRLVELVHLLAAASTVTRKEAHLAILLEHLAALVADPASPLATPALHALASLTRRSYVGAKAALAFLPIDKLTLVAFTRPVDQVWEGLGNCTLYSVSWDYDDNTYPTRILTLVYSLDGGRCVRAGAI